MSEPEDQGYRPIPDDLRKMLDEHADWVKTRHKRRKKGKCLTLPGYDFQKLNLNGETLIRAKLRKANFQGANLFKAKLGGADLRKAEFAQADLAEADFQDANLEGADLAASRNLNNLRLARANLKNCRLPQDQQEFTGLDYVKDAANISGQIFAALLIGGVYTFCTVFSMTDVALLTNSGATPLPIFGSTINVTSFYLAAPLLLLLTYVYFHLNLQHLWGALAALPAIFPDGQRLDQRVFPWLFNWLPNSHFKQLKELKGRDRIFLSLQKGSVYIFAWFFVPFILLCVWFRYLYVRNVWVTTVHVAIITAAALFGFWFSRLAANTLRGKYLMSSKRIYLNFIMTGVVLVVLCFITDGFLRGLPAQLEKKNRPQEKIRVHQWLFPEILYQYLGHIEIVANFEEQEVSTKVTKGDNAKGDQGAGKDIPVAKGAPLRGRDLRYAKAKGAFLARADLREATLEGAYLRKADLREAKLGEAGVDKDGANLARAFLFEADLSKACLYNAKLHKAMLIGAKLQGTDLERADLTEANLAYAKLQEAKFNKAVLRGANIQEADLRKAKDLKAEDFKQARCWALAYYDDDLLPKLGLPQNHNEQVKDNNLSSPSPRTMKDKNLQNADLSLFDLRGVNFAGANLRGACLRNNEKLSGAILTGAQLNWAMLQGANLANVHGLTKDQLRAAKSWVLAFYNANQLNMLGLPLDHNENLRAKNLRGRSLQGMDLRGADLDGFDLAGAQMELTNLRGADLSGAKNLTWEQLKLAKRDKNTRLPEYLEKTRPAADKRKE